MGTVPEVTRSEEMGFEKRLTCFQHVEFPGFAGFLDWDHCYKLVAT